MPRNRALILTALLLLATPSLPAQSGEPAVVMDQAWEGNAVNYVTVFRHGQLYRMYYRGAGVKHSKEGCRETHRQVTCYAESKGGIHWTKPVFLRFVIKDADVYSFRLPD